MFTGKNRWTILLLSSVVTGMVVETRAHGHRISFPIVKTLNSDLNLKIAVQEKAMSGNKIYNNNYYKLERICITKCRIAHYIISYNNN